SCSKKTDCCVNVDTAVDLIYESGGLNLFDPTGGLYDPSDIAVEYLMGTEWVAINPSNGRGYLLYHNETIDAHVLRIFPNAEGDQNERSVRITISSLLPDIIEIEMARSGASTIATKVWCNGELRWDAAAGKSNEFEHLRMFSITKVLR